MAVLYCAHDGLERNNNSPKILRNGVCKRCTRLFHFSFAFVLTKKFSELRSRFGLCATTAIRTPRDSSALALEKDSQDNRAS